MKTQGDDLIDGAPYLKSLGRINLGRVNVGRLVMSVVGSFTE